MDKNLKLREAVEIFYKENGFPKDGGVSDDKWSPIGCRDLKVYLPNFEWRKRAIPYHDLHHVITEYPFSPLGEFQISAWEFAAGKYPNILTTLFCIPLVSMGAVLIPKKTFNAFVRGRNSKTLYKNMAYENLLERTVNDVREEVLPKKEFKPTIVDFILYLKLVTMSAFVTSIPFCFLVIIYLIGVG